MTRTNPVPTSVPRQVGSDLLLAPAHAQAALMRSGEVSARELVEALLRAIERLDRELNAFCHLAPERALAEAGRIGHGDPRPLCGLPIAIKDFLTATEGLPTTEGSSAFGDRVADHDSAHVRRLRDAGAIVIGKTNTPELALRPVTENERYGATETRTTAAWGPAAPPAAAPPRSPPGWRHSPTGPTLAARSGSRPRAAG